MIVKIANLPDNNIINGLDKYDVDCILFSGSEEKIEELSEKLTPKYTSLFPYDENGQLHHNALLSKYASQDTRNYAIGEPGSNSELIYGRIVIQGENLHLFSMTNFSEKHETMMALIKLVEIIKGIELGEAIIIRSNVKEQESREMISNSLNTIEGMTDMNKAIYSKNLHIDKIEIIDNAQIISYK
ncbi:MAG: hypothetical protein FWC79_06565 [Oscillospiraceae bacterium]|nr:hypothetical protein [Oscillospiraceae bacterium]